MPISTTEYSGVKREMSQTKEWTQEEIARVKRVNRLKKMIMISVFSIILLLLVGCGILLFQNISLKNHDKELKKEIVELQEENSLLNKALDEQATQQAEDMVEENGEGQPEAAPEQQPAAQPDGQVSATKKVYLTFDDGPSSNTGKILDILNQYGIKATFFVVGRTDDESKALYQRIVNEGHSIGIHSYTHKYSSIYESMESFSQDVLSLQSLIKEFTGKETFLYRFPGGSSNTVSNIDMKDAIRFLKANGFTYYDWNASNGDATGKQLPVETMVENVLNDLPKYNNLTVLMHDGSGKETTVESLPLLIQKLQESGVEILPIDENTTPVQHVKAENVS